MIQRGIALTALAVLASPAGGTETEPTRPTFLYCKHKHFVTYPTSLGCRAGFGTTPNAGCNGGVPSSIDKINVKEVKDSYTRCNDGDWLTRIEIKSPDS